MADVGDKIYDLIQNANSLQYEFLDNDSEYDNIARECLIRNLEYIIQWFHLPINLEEALAEREWVKIYLIINVINLKA